jgi:PAS domain S-box-containing protein
MFVLVQSQLIDSITFRLGNTTAPEFSISIWIAPLIIFATLIIYIYEGTIQTRSMLLGMIYITFIVSFFRVLTLSDVIQPWFWFQSSIKPEIFPQRMILASIITLPLDLVFLVVIYQAITNLRQRYPSRWAGSISLLSTLGLDTLIHSYLTVGGTQDFTQYFQYRLVSNMVSGIFLLPILIVYLQKWGNKMGSEAARTPHAVLDIFTTTVKLEAQAQHRYALLHTLVQINELVASTADIHTLIDRACQLLVENRDYRSAWIYVRGEYPHFARYGNDSLSLPNEPDKMISWIESNDLFGSVFQTGKSHILKELTHIKDSSAWIANALAKGVSSLAIFPLNYQGQVNGVLCIYTGRASTFDREEIDLLEELGNDLALAVVNLAARQRQAILYSASETMLDGLLVCDLDLKILYANHAMARLFNLTQAGMIGCSLREIIPDEINLVEQFNKLLSQGILQEEFVVHRKSGHLSVFEVRASLVQVDHDQSKQIVFTVRDGTERRRYEERLLALNRLITDLVQIYDVQDLLRKILRSSEVLLEAWASALYIFSEEKGTVTEFIVNNLSEEYGKRIAQDFRGLPGETLLRTLRPVVVSDVLNSPDYGERILFMADFGIRSLLLLPILYQNLVLGALVVYYDQPRVVTDEELQLGLTLAHTIAIVIKNAQLYVAEHSQRQLAEALAQAAASVNQKLNLSDVLTQILQQTLRVAGCKYANIMLIDGNEVVVAQRMGYDSLSIHDYEKEERYSINLHTLKQMMDSGEPVLMSRTKQEPLWINTPGSEWIESYAGVPLKVGDRIVGFLNVDSDQPDNFQLETITRLQALAAHTAIAVYNAQLFEDTRRQSEELSTLFKAAATVSTSLDMNQVLRSIGQQMAELVDVDVCAISDYDPFQRTVKLLVNYSKVSYVEAEEIYLPFNIDKYPLTRKVLEDFLPVQVHTKDPDADPAEKKLLEIEGWATLLMLPLIWLDQAIGLVELQSHDPDRIFTQREIALLQTLSTHAANALQNARFFGQLQNYTNMLEERVRERTEDLQAAKERMESILAAVPEAVIVLDEKGQPVIANQAGEILRVQAKQQALDLFAPDFLSTLRKGGAPPEKAVIEVQGRVYQAISSALSIQSQQAGLVVVYRDVTRFLELDRLKTQFVSDVSHELRTPLTNLRLYLDLMTTQSDPGLRQKYLGTLHREAMRLSHLIEDLLMISRLEAGRVKFHIIPVDVNLMLAEFAQDRKTMASNMGLELVYEPPEQNPSALADPRLLNQALSNLITNAFNYTPSGGKVTLSYRVEVNHDSTWVAIQVSDTGVGIKPDEINQIFERFYRGSASSQTGAPGTGLGLSISCEIIERIGGWISVESQPGLGSTFTVWLKAVL